MLLDERAVTDKALVAKATHDVLVDHLFRQGPEYLNTCVRKSAAYILPEGVPAGTRRWPLPRGLR